MTIRSNLVCFRQFFAILETGIQFEPFCECKSVEKVIYCAFTHSEVKTILELDTAMTEVQNLYIMMYFERPGSMTVSLSIQADQSVTNKNKSKRAFCNRRRIYLHSSMFECQRFSHLCNCVGRRTLNNNGDDF